MNTDQHMVDIENPNPNPNPVPPPRPPSQPRVGQVQTINIDFDQQFHRETQEKLLLGLSLLNFLVFLPLICYTIVRYHEDPDYSSANLFWVLLFFEIVTMAEAVFLPMKFELMKKYPLMLLDIWLFSTTRVIMYIGFILYISGKLRPGTSLVLFTYPDVLAYLFFACKKDPNRSKTINFMTSLTFSSVASYVDGGSAMTLVLGFTFFFGLALFLFILFCSYLFFVFMILKYYLMIPAQLHEMVPDFQNGFWKKYGILVASSIYLGVGTFAFTLMIFGAFSAVILGFVTNNKEQMSDSFWLGSKIMFWFSLIHIGLAALLISQSWSQIMEMFHKMRPREIVISRFSKSINLNFIQKGVNYFIKRGSTSEPLLEQNKVGVDLSQPPECQICMTNFCDTLFDPCGHYITCQVCLKDYFKRSFDCIMCRKRIERVHLIYFDQEEKKYKSEGTYDINV